MSIFNTSFRSGGFKVTPDLYIPINYYKYGINGYDSTGVVRYAGISDSYYGHGKWSNSDKSISLYDGVTYSIGVISGTHIKSHVGGFSTWYKPHVDYDGYSDIAYLLYIENHLKVYYDNSDNKFKFDFYDGSGYNVNLESSTQSFVSGTWIFIGISYSTYNGCLLAVDNVLEDYISSGTFSGNTIPALINIGSVSGTATNAANGYLDDICIYSKYVSFNVHKTRYGENHSND